MSDSKFTTPEAIIEEALRITREETDGFAVAAEFVAEQYNTLVQSARDAKKESKAKGAKTLTEDAVLDSVAYKSTVKEAESRLWEALVIIEKLMLDEPLTSLFFYRALNDFKKGMVSELRDHTLQWANVYADVTVVTEDSDEDEDVTDTLDSAELGTLRDKIGAFEMMAQMQGQRDPKVPSLSKLTGLSKKRKTTDSSVATDKTFWFADGLLTPWPNVDIFAVRELSNEENGLVTGTDVRKQVRSTLGEFTETETWTCDVYDVSVTLLRVPNNENLSDFTFTDEDGDVWFGDEEEYQTDSE